MCVGGGFDLNHFSSNDKEIDCKLIRYTGTRKCLGDTSARADQGGLNYRRKTETMIQGGLETALAKEKLLDQAEPWKKHSKYMQTSFLLKLFISLSSPP